MERIQACPEKLTAWQLGGYTMLLADVFDRVIPECGLKLMTAYGAAVSVDTGRSGNQIGTRDQAAIIGYSGSEIPGGTIALWISNSLLQETCPSSDEQTDWLSELLNQLIGRILNRLLAYDLHLVQSTPVVVRGKHLDLSFSGDYTRHYVFLNVNQQPVMEIYFESSFKQDYDVQLNTTTSQSISEGESIIF